MRQLLTTLAALSAMAVLGPLADARAVEPANRPTTVAEASWTHVPTALQTTTAVYHPQSDPASYQPVHWYRGGGPYYYSGRSYRYGWHTPYPYYSYGYPYYSAYPYYSYYGRYPYYYYSARRPYFSWGGVWY